MAQAQNDMNRDQVKPSQIKDEIDHTRAEMDATLDQLGERLNPRHALNDFLSYFRTEGGEVDKEKVAQSLKQGASAIGHQVMQHPIPSALFLAGAGYLAYELTQGRSDLDEETFPTEEGTYGGSYVDARTGGPYTSDYGQEAGFHPEAQGKLGKAREKVAGAATKVKEAASYATERAGEAGSKMRARAGMAGQRVQQGVSYGRTQLRDTWDQHPVAVTATVVGLGLLLGWSLPTMRRRREW